MITIKNGNLLLAEEDIIAHQVNIEGAMGAGVAKAIKEKYPVVYEEYSNYCRDNSAENRQNLLGRISATKISQEKNQWIMNLFAQSLIPMFDDETRCTDYKAFETSLKKARVWMKSNNMKSIALPYKVGSALGGGNWDVVMGIIMKIFMEENSDIDVVIYKLVLE